MLIKDWSTCLEALDAGEILKGHNFEIQKIKLVTS